MKPVELSVVINRPLEECFAYLTDLGKDVEWRREWIDAEKTTDGPHGVGARYRLTGALLGRRIATEYEAIAYKPVSGTLQTNNIYAFEPNAGGTVVTLTDEIELDGILGLFEPLLGAMVRRQYRANLGRLKAIMETQVAAGS
jgi:hypothetical protein